MDGLVRGMDREPTAQMIEIALMIKEISESGMGDLFFFFFFVSKLYTQVSIAVMVLSLLFGIAAAIYILRSLLRLALLFRPIFLR